jgi:hypothetical protein
MGFLDKLFGRDKSSGREGGSGGDAGGGREGARVTEPARTSGEGTRPAQPPDAERHEGAGPDRGPN